MILSGIPPQHGAAFREPAATDEHYDGLRRFQSGMPPQSVLVAVPMSVLSPCRSRSAPCPPRRRRETVREGSPLAPSMQASGQEGNKPTNYRRIRLSCFRCRMNVTTVRFGARCESPPLTNRSYKIAGDFRKGEFVPSNELSRDKLQRSIPGIIRKR